MRKRKKLTRTELVMWALLVTCAAAIIYSWFSPGAAKGQIPPRYSCAPGIILPQPGNETGGVQVGEAIAIIHKTRKVAGYRVHLDFTQDQLDLRRLTVNVSLTRHRKLFANPILEATVDLSLWREPLKGGDLRNFDRCKETERSYGEGKNLQHTAIWWLSNSRHKFYVHAHVTIVTATGVHSKQFMLAVPTRFPNLAVRHPAL